MKDSSKIEDFGILNPMISNIFLSILIIYYSVNLLWPKVYATKVTLMRFTSSCF